LDIQRKINIIREIQTLKNIWNYSIETNIIENIQLHSKNIKLFFIIFTINIIIFGQKIFYFSLPADDYMRFYGDHNTQMLITNSARWGQALLNKYIFVDALQILPYLHGLIGVFAFTLMGFLTAQYFRREKTIDLVLITLLISTTPMLAHNLYFSTNITTWITLCLGLIGFLIAQKPSWVFKITGFVLLIFAISNYQTIIQIITLMIILNSIIRLMNLQNTQELKTIIHNSIGYLFFLFLAFLISSMINEIFLHYYHLHVTHRLAQAETGINFTLYIERLKTTYQTMVHLNYFEKQLHLLYILMGILAFIGVFIYSLRAHTKFPLKSFILVLQIILFLSIPLILNLPLLLGVDIPTRAHFTIGWALAGFYLLQRMTFNIFFKSLSSILALLIIFINIYYITIFFDANIRQTQSDIRRANMIVERIRTDEHYTNEPMGFNIQGSQKYNVLGWDMQWQQPFNSYWAKYKIFRFFTDYNFHFMSKKESNELTQYIIRHYDKIYPYPGKNSVIVHNNNAIVFLNSDKINIAINKQKNIANFSKDHPADINASFNLYIENNTLFYYKKTCTNEDIKNKFFLRIYPKDPVHTMINGRLGGAFQTWDFNFDLHGIKINGSCIAAVELPKQYEIEKIRTGQFKPGGLDWDVYYFIQSPNKD